MIKIKSENFIRDTAFLGFTIVMIFLANLMTIFGGGFYEVAVHIIVFAMVMLNISIFCSILTDIRRNFAIFIFVVSFNILLLGRVYVSYFGRYSQMLTLLEADSYANLFNALQIIIISLLSVYFAYCLAGLIFDKRETSIKQKGVKAVKQNELSPIIRQLSVAVLLVSSVALFYTLFKTVINVIRNGYLNSFTNSVSVPSVISRLSMFFIPAFAVFLATMPNKKQLKLPMIIYCVYMATSALTGRRNTLVCEALMLMIYFVMRDNLLELDKRKLKKSTVIYTGVLGIAAMYFLQLFAIVRAGVSDASRNIGSMIIGFFDSQGASFRVVIQTVNNINMFDLSTSYQYLFYPFEMFVHNNIVTRTVFGLTPIIEVQNYEFVKTTHNFAHVLTYMVDPHRYLSGGGFGTSYVAEAYIAYGILGVIVISLMIGLIFRFFSSLLTYSWVVIACGLIAIKNFVYIPRNFAFMWVTSVLNITYICFFVSIYIVALLIAKGTHVRSINQLSAKPFVLEEKL